MPEMRLFQLLLSKIVVTVEPVSGCLANDINNVYISAKVILCAFFLVSSV